MLVSTQAGFKEGIFIEEENILDIREIISII